MHSTKQYYSSSHTWTTVVHFEINGHKKLPNEAALLHDMIKKLFPCLKKRHFCGF